MEDLGINFETEYQLKKGLARQYWEYELNRLADLEDKIENGTIASELKHKIEYNERTGYFELAVPFVEYRCYLCDTREEAEKRLEELRK